MLDHEEYVEQAYFFRILGERLLQNTPTQDLLALAREEILATTKLPLAIDFLSAELRMKGVFAPAMEKLAHYFTTFQTFVVSEAERDRGKFDLTIALQILEREALYRAEGASPQGIFLYQFECLCRNRLGYELGMEAMAGDWIFTEDWRAWIATVRRQIGLVDIADLIYVRSQYYQTQQAMLGREDAEPKAVLFGEKEGRIAVANRQKDPLLLFAALQRHLGYPAVPKPAVVDETPKLIPTLARRIERLEARLKLLEEEQKGGIYITKFYGHDLPGRSSADES